MLWPSLPNLSRIFHRDCGLAISATTNGSTLHRPAVRQMVLEDFAELTVSVDGFAPRHDALRHSLGSWDRLADGVQVLAERRKAHERQLRLRANIVLMRDSVADFPGLCRTLVEWGIDEITFNQLGGRDRPEYYPANRLQPPDVLQLRSLLPALRDELASRDVRLCAHPSYLDRIAATTSDQPLQVEDCGPGEQFLFIDENNMISPCSFTTQAYGVPTSWICTVDDLAALPDHFRKARRLRRSVDCDDCPSTQTFSKFAA